MRSLKGKNGNKVSSEIAINFQLSTCLPLLGAADPVPRSEETGSDPWADTTSFGDHFQSSPPQGQSPQVPQIRRSGRQKRWARGYPNRQPQRNRQTLSSPMHPVGTTVGLGQQYGAPQPSRSYPQNLKVRPTPPNRPSTFPTQWEPPAPFRFV